MHAAVEQARDAGMFEARENLALRLEARGFRNCASMQHLDGDFLLECAVRANREIDLAGAAASRSGAAAATGRGVCLRPVPL